MQFSLMLTEQILQLFFSMLCGFLIVRTKILPGSASKTLSKINTYVLTPCLALSSFQIERTSERMQDFLLLVVAALGAHALFILLTALLRRPMRLSPTERASLIFSNCGMVIPLVHALFGSEMVFANHAFGMVQILLLWTYGYRIISGEGKMPIYKFLNINVLAMLAGLALFLLQWRLPTVVSDALGNLGDMMGQFNMLAIGMLIGGVRLKEVFLCKRAYAMAALRLAVYPLALILLFRVAGIVQWASTPLLLSITTLAAAAPSAATVVSIALVKNQETDMAVRVNIVTTVLCILTMPLLLQLYQWLLT